MLSGKPLYMKFIDYRFMQRRLGQAVVLPIEMCARYNGFGNSRCIVLFTLAQIRLRIAQFIAENRVLPIHLAGNGAGIRVDKKLGRIEPQALFRLIRSMNPIPIKLANGQARYITMPNIAGRFSEWNDLRFGRVYFVEKTKIDASGVLGVNSKIDAGPIPCRALGVRRSWQDVRRHSIRLSRSSPVP